MTVVLHRQWHLPPPTLNAWQGDVFSLSTKVTMDRKINKYFLSCVRFKQFLKKYRTYTIASYLHSCRMKKCVTIEEDEGYIRLSGSLTYSWRSMHGQLWTFLTCLRNSDSWIIRATVILPRCTGHCMLAKCSIRYTPAHTYTRTHKSDIKRSMCNLTFTDFRGHLTNKRDDAYTYSHTHSLTEGEKIRTVFSFGRYQLVRTHDIVIHIF